MTAMETPHTRDVSRLRDDWRLRCVVNSNVATWDISPSSEMRQLALRRQ